MSAAQLSVAAFSPATPAGIRRPERLLPLVTRAYDAWCERGSCDLPGGLTAGDLQVVSEDEACCWMPAFDAERIIAEAEQHRSGADSYTQALEWAIDHLAMLEILAEDERRAAEENEREFAAWQADRQIAGECLAAIDAALGQLDWHTNQAGSSHYGRYRGIEIRVSDHAQPAFGGYNAGTGETYGASDVCFTLTAGDELPTGQEIRDAVAEALWANR